MKSQKRWMQSIIETSKIDLPALPWQRKKITKAFAGSEKQRQSA
ncbi:MAG: hypothetical protein R3256_02970 [Thalassovita sp.]|nr:hypothetical protein [Thalassovita sp.]